MIHVQNAKDHDLYFIAHGAHGTQYIGRTPKGLITESGQPNFLVGTDAAEILEKSKKLGWAGFKELPNTKDSVILPDEFYLMGDRLVYSKTRFEVTKDGGLDTADPILFVSTVESIGETK